MWGLIPSSTMCVEIVLYVLPVLWGLLYVLLFAPQSKEMHWWMIGISKLFVVISCALQSVDTPSRMFPTLCPKSPGIDSRFPAFGISDTENGWMDRSLFLVIPFRKWHCSFSFLVDNFKHKLLTQPYTYSVLSQLHANLLAMNDAKYCML